MQEIWDLLDKNGNEIGKTIKKGEEIPIGYYHLGADVWIVNEEGKILIQKRSIMKKLSPNLWAMTGGSVIKGETSLETIERETYEELGIKLKMENVQFIGKYRVEGMKVWVNEYVIEQEIDLKEVVMKKEEVCEVKWATCEEIEEIWKNGQFIENRWEFVRDGIKRFISK